ncbi:neuropeptide CCHamide-2 isoform X1 [Cylas formicarius]|uniref:neuropeptide CCHamide-2 isoform X1 n=1 Tax=Cylas formicarius TaxID=197179 RepID=UPI0029588390|nr:neuropeptide CCHamide-2 isoform X1 [Cylas formicarius]
MLTKIGKTWRSMLFLTFCAIVLFGVDTDSRRGCASFGHSCFGGMGKRGSYDANPQMHQDDSILNVGNENGMPIKLVLNNKLTASDLTRYIINQWVTNYLRERDDFNEKK